MHSTGFADFAARIIPSYAAAMVIAGEWKPLTSLAQARADFDGRLPAGLKTPGHVFLTVKPLDRIESVGDLWLQYRIEAGKQVCTVLDIFIKPHERRHGYGKAALCAAEVLASDYGAIEMRLTVVGENLAARNLYRQIGYEILNARLAKPLCKHRR